MPETGVTRWFGPRFADLHPLLQSLHRDGGRLSGEVEIEANWLGRRLGRRLGIPADRGDCGFTVEIRHEDCVLHWERRFEGGSALISLFRPVGAWPDGYWVESTGALQMDLTVDIVEGGWYWRPLRARIGRLPIPLFLFPRVEAYKRIEGECYRFTVSFALPVIGQVLHYRGLLTLDRRE